MHLTTRKQSATILQRHSANDLFHTLDTEQYQQYTKLQQELLMLTPHLMTTDNVYDTIQQITDIHEQFNRLLYVYTNVNTIDTFIHINRHISQQSILLQLNTDIVINILQCLNFIDLIELRLTCVELRQIIFDPYVWQYTPNTPIERDYVGFNYKPKRLCWYLRIAKPSKLRLNLPTIQYILNCCDSIDLNHHNYGIQQRLRSVTDLTVSALYEMDVLSLQLPNVQHLTYDTRVCCERIKETDARHILQFQKLYSITIEIFIGFCYCKPVDPIYITIIDIWKHIPCINITIVDDKEYGHSSCNNKPSRTTSAEYFYIIQQYIDELVQRSNVNIRKIVAPKSESFDHNAVRIQRHKQSCVDSMTVTG